MGLGPNGGGLYADLIADARGNLFGATIFGGTNNRGTVFEIAKTASGYSSAPSTLVSFNGANGAAPYSFAGLIADASGNLLGTTERGGASNQGTVFMIAKTAGGYSSAPVILVSFNGSNGRIPYAGLIADANGNLFGTTSGGGANNQGTVFMIAKTAGGYASEPVTLVSFNGANGAAPFASLLADANGNLFGATTGGGASGLGTVFMIVKTTGGYSSAPVTLVSFNGANGALPRSVLIADASGNLFGTTDGGTTEGGSAINKGTVFMIAKTAGGYASAPITLVSFNGANGLAPFAGLIADAKGNLFGTTKFGGANNQGTVFMIAKIASGYASAPATLVSFNYTNGLAPFAGLIADANGNLFGTTVGGGANNQGTVFKITDSGFVVPPTFAGTPGQANCHGKSVAGLAKQYGGLNTAAYKLGFSSAMQLQGAIKGFCEKT